MPEVIAPAAPSTTNAPGNSSQVDAMEMVVKNSLDTTAAEQAPPTAAPAVPVGSTGERARDPRTGQFLPGTPGAAPVEGTQPSALSTPALPADAPTDGGGVIEDLPEVVIPEGYVAPEIVPEDKQNGWKVFDKEGEVAAPDLLWHVNTSAGDRELSTDALIQYARRGVFNERREQQVQTAVNDARQVSQQLQQSQTYAQRLEQQMEALFQSDEAYLQARAQYDHQNTPEMRIERERQARIAAEERVQLVQVQASGTQFFNATVVPAIDTITKALGTVTADEIGARLFMQTEHMRVHTSAGSIFPPASYQRIQEVLLQDVVPWAQQLHEHREHEQKRPNTRTHAAEQQAATARQEKDAALVRAQKARRVATTATRPASAPPTGPSGRTQLPVRTAKDAESAVIGNTMAALRGS